VPRTPRCYGVCERSLGSSGNAFFNSLWQQAASQGMTVLVASMDSGAAGCDAMEAPKAVGGLAINGLGWTVFNTAVGGTQFDETNRTQYWAATNDPVTQASSAATAGTSTITLKATAGDVVRSKTLTLTVK